MQDTRSRTARETPANRVESIVKQYYEERAEDAKTPAKAPSSSNSRVWLVFLLASSLLAAVWLVPSLNPVRSTEVSPQLLEQSARLTIYLAAVRLNELKSANGAVPTSLAQARIDDPGLVFERESDSSYMLSMSLGEYSLRYRSNEDLAAFGGPAAAMLRSR